MIAMAVLLMLALVLPMMTARAAATGAASNLPAATGPPTQTPADAAPDLVVVGTSGLRWEDLSALATPNLWDLADGGASANLVARSVRSSACPADGWLAISAGRRAADLPLEEYGTCRRLLSPDTSGAVPAWDAFLQAAADDGYDARPGLLGDRLVSADVSSLAVGPGAAVALATSAGQVAGEYFYADFRPSLLEGSLAAALPGHELAVVDVGTIRDHNRPLVHPSPGEVREKAPQPEETPSPAPDEAWLLSSPERTEQVATVDARVGAVVDAARSLSPDTTIIVASVADSGSIALMQLMVAAGPGVPGELPEDGALLRSSSTRQPGIVQSTDLTPTILQVLDVDAPAGLVGSSVRAVPDGRDGPARVSALVDAHDHAVAVRPLKGPFHSALVLVNLLLYASVTVGLNRRLLDRAAAWFARRRSPAAGRVAASLRSRRPGAALRTVRTVAVAVGALPVASYLANLVPWWRADNPGLALYGLTLLVTVAITAVALARPWRHRLLAPVAVVAGLTAVVLAVDVVTGASLQISALMGVQPEVGGRFYGFNNSSFSLFAAGTILTCTAVADPLVRAGRRKLAGAVILAVGAVAVVLDGAPAFGADFGGPPALIPGFLVLALLVAGVALTWRRIIVVLGVTGLIALSFSVLDWLRPPAERTHLGRFIETVLDGGLWAVVARKLAQNVSNLFGSTLTFLAIGGIVVVIVLLTRPLRQAARSDEGERYGWLTGDSSRARVDQLTLLLRPALYSLGVTFAIAFAVNDSGVVLPAIGVSLAVPLLVAVLTGWLLARGGDPQFSSGDDVSAGSPSRGSAHAR
ncbi:hypothetical protein GCM10023169_28620 [Georgenia halophila]|uniref:Uncharacterized protein n=1 Tax=Georgenia halophila TaxID=620889 RepID=A0ABP8LGK8_9MICO